MKYALVALVAVLGLSACAGIQEQIDRINPEIRCMLEPVAYAKADEYGVPVRELLKEFDLVICPAPTVEEAVTEGYTVVE